MNINLFTYFFKDSNTHKADLTMLEVISCQGGEEIK